MPAVSCRLMNPGLALPLLLVVACGAPGSAPGSAQTHTAEAVAVVPADGSTDPLDSEQVFASDSHGFRIALPAEGWVFAETPRTADGSLELKLGPVSAAGLVHAKVTAKIDAEVTEPELVREAMRAYLAGRPQYGEPEDVEAQVAGREAPGLDVQVAVEAEGYPDVQVRQLYLHEGDVRYIVETMTPVGQREQWNGDLVRALESLELVSPSAEALAERALLALGKRVDEGIGWASSWRSASERARSEGRLVLVRVHVYRGFNLPDTGIAALLLDPDVTAMIQERFVPLRWVPGMDAPFETQDRYGMGPSTFGATFLIVTPDGEVLHEGNVLLDDVLREGLALAESAGWDLGGEAPADRIERAEWHARRGQLDAAAALLPDPTTAREHLALASITRRLRRGDAALAHLSAAHAAAVGEESDRQLAARLAFEEGLLHVGLGHTDVAIRHFAVAALGRSDESYAAGALFGLGACLSAEGDAAGAEVTWRRLCAEHPESSWAWATASLLSSPMFELMGELDVAWPPADVVRIMARHERAPLSPADAPRAAADALAWLMAAQREDGSWPCGSQAGGSSEQPDDFVLATTALAARALLASRTGQADGTLTSVQRAIDWLAAALARARAEEEPVYYMDYTVWSRSCVLWLLADAVDAGLGNAAEHRETMAGALADLASREQSGGGWSYLLSTTATGEPLSQTISFTTAFAILALQRARASEVVVPEALLDAALDCLESMHVGNGVYAYMFSHGGPGQPPPTGDVGAACRGPLCALALHRAGRADLDHVRDGLALYDSYRGGLTREAGKLLMHAGEDGQGSHYVLFDHAMTAEAIGALPPEEHTRWASGVLEELLAIRRDDGSYVDLPLLGPATGTAFALLTLQALEPPQAE